VIDCKSFSEGMWNIKIGKRKRSTAVYACQLIVDKFSEHKERLKHYVSPKVPTMWQGG
jgi:hypothetical protein